MGYYDFPHTRNYDTDLGYLIKQYYELETKYSDLEPKLKAYTDEKVSEALTTIRAELAETVVELNAKYEAFTTNINEQMNTFNQYINNRINTISADLDAKIAAFEKKLEEYELLLTQIQAAMKSYTDKSISVYDTYIKNYIANQVIDAKVINYFTGEKISIQAMFDYLSQFHLEGAISYSQLATRENTYVDYREINMTFTQLAINGYNLIPQK